MPRHTHPCPRRTHDRGHVREQRDRYIKRRWRLAKTLYGYDAVLHPAYRPGPVTDEDYRLWHSLGRCGRQWLIHPEVARRLPTWLAPWPFNIDRGRFTRNPFTTCSCLACTGWKRLDPRRAREQREWRAEME